MKKILFLLVSFVLCGIVIFAQDSTDNKKNEFVLKLVNDIVAACEEGNDTTMRTDVVMTSDSLKSYIISVAKGDSIVFDSLTTEERDKVVDFVKVVA